MVQATRSEKVAWQGELRTQTGGGLMRDDGEAIVFAPCGCSIAGEGD